MSIPYNNHSDNVLPEDLNPGIEAEEYITDKVNGINRESQKKYSHVEITAKFVDQAVSQFKNPFGEIEEYDQNRDFLNIHGQRKYV